MNNTKYIDNATLKAYLGDLIIKVESINKKYGLLSDFIEEYNFHGSTNGDLYIFNKYDNTKIITPQELIDCTLTPLGFKINEDYIFAFETLFAPSFITNESLIHKGPSRFLKWTGGDLKNYKYNPWQYNDIYAKIKKMIIINESKKKEQEYAFSFSKMTNQKLVDEFNKLRWIFLEKDAYPYKKAFYFEFNRRQLDFSEIADNETISYANDITLKENKIHIINN